ncbi:P-loop containing nucleoside triphosphate hydrolase protein [Sphaerosporella brunnea]|uniref:P-loop containing nucleoside triphosphate hydrolase protein n=1 Tax=Sphaerosporella brunnea TaxID=1250544 RepID=A0A5J5EXS4_9PEZI|nr:P-loop containing nucleoside triphosphate hydrolase protein [Sphaerosporella brunnea]
MMTTSASFSSLNIDKWLVDSLSAMAIRKPTPIQAACIPPILAGKDCIGGSRTGSGKTVAFAVPILQQWAKDPFGVFAVVLTPTRELAIQIAEQFTALGAPQNLKICLLIGGVDMRTQALSLGTRPHVVIATPGRMADHIHSSGEDTICGLRRAKIVVLDEADRMLSETFAQDLGDCLEVLPKAGKDGRQTLLFTATMTEEVKMLKELEGREGRRECFVCEVETDKVAIPPTLDQRYLLLNSFTREAYLHTLLSTPGNENKSTIVFTNRTETANLLTHILRQLGHRVTALHSQLAQSDRIDSLGRFRAEAARILVATDVASRGLDIPVVELVVNYDVPRDPDDYIHRVGRTARAGKAGEAITFVSERDVALAENIETRIGTKLEKYVDEPGVSLEGRVVRETLQLVSEKKRVAKMDIDEGRNEMGKRKRKLVEKANKRKKAVRGE